MKPDIIPKKIVEELKLIEEAVTAGNNIVFLKKRQSGRQFVRNLMQSQDTFYEEVSQKRLTMAEFEDGKMAMVKNEPFLGKWAGQAVRLTAKKPGEPIWEVKNEATGEVVQIEEKYLNEY